MNEQLYKEALDAIQKLFNDTSVSQETAQENLQALITEIEVMLDSMDN